MWKNRVDPPAKLPLASARKKVYNFPGFSRHSSLVATPSHLKPEHSTDCRALDWPALIAAACMGDDGAAGEVFARLANYCTMVAGSRLPADLGSKLGASDIVQKSFVEAFSQFASFSGSTEAEIRGWLRTIIDRNVIDAVRHYRHTARRDSAKERSLDGSGALDLADSGRPPSFAMRRLEEDGALAQAVAALDEKRRRIIELRFRDGLAFREAAAAMGISEVSARKLCSRAVDDLRKMLGSDAGAKR